LSQLAVTRYVYCDRHVTARMLIAIRSWSIKNSQSGCKDLPVYKLRKRWFRIEKNRQENEELEKMVSGKRMHWIQVIQHHRHGVWLVKGG